MGRRAACGRGGEPLGLRRGRRGARRARRPRGAASTSSARSTRRHPGRRRRRAAGAAARPATRPPTCRRCASWSASCERQGCVTRGDDGLRLTPKALRRLGQTALRRVFAQLEAAGRGDHDDRAGAADELTGLPGRGSSATSSRSTWSARSATRVRRAGLPGPSTGSGAGRAARSRTSRCRDRAADAAPRWRCASTCRSRWCSDGRWGPMKQTALALPHLVATRFPQDALQIIGFDRSRAAGSRRCSWPRSSRSGCRAPTCSTR